MTIDRDRMKKSRQIAIQAAYYVGAFYVAWIFPTIFQLVLVTSGEVYFVLLFLTAFFVPIKGLLNLIVFVRPKYGRYLRKNPDQFFVRAWFQMIWAELGCRTESSSGAVTSARSRVKFSWRPSFAGPSMDQLAAAAASTTAAKGEPGQEGINS